MAAPFQIPGHRWDPQKKRFFKETAGAAPVSEAAASTQPSDAGVQKDVVSLPAVASTSPMSAFGVRRLDPVSLRSRVGRSNATTLARQIIGSTYSQLAVHQVRKFPGTSVQHVQTNSRSILVLLADNSILRLSPWHREVETVRRYSLSLAPAEIFHYNNSDLHIKYSAPYGKRDLEILSIADARTHRELLMNHHTEPLFSVKVEHNTRLVGVRACAVHSTGAKTYIACCHDQSVSIINTATNRNQIEPRPRWSSDTTTVAFRDTGNEIYVGLRSGKIATCRWHGPASWRFIPTSSKGAVANIGTSARGLVVTWTSGDVRLINADTFETILNYTGHVNTYMFGLGFAIEPRLNLIALAGQDNRVRVWSLDASSPLTASTQRSFAEEEAKQGTPIADIQFSDVVKCLHWGPRSFDEVPELADTSSPICSPWSDLFAACGELMYHFRWP